MASGDIIINKEVISAKKSEFSNCKSKFQSGAYNTFKSSYLSTCSDSYVSVLKNKLDSEYQKIQNGYSSIVSWLDEYVSEVDNNESNISSSVSDVSVSSVASLAALNISLGEFKSGSSKVLYGGTSVSATKDKMFDFGEKESVLSLIKKYNAGKISATEFLAGLTLSRLHMFDKAVESNEKRKKELDEYNEEMLKRVAEEEVKKKNTKTVSAAEREPFPTNSKEAFETAVKMKASANKSSSSGIVSGIGEAVKTVAAAATASVNKINSSNSSSKSSKNSSSSKSGSTSSSISNSASNSSSVNKVEQSTSNTTGTTSDSNQGNVSDNVNNTDGNKSNITNENGQNTGGNNVSNGSNSGTISDNVNNTDGDKSNITNGTNSGTSGTDIGNGNVTEDLLKTKIDKAINDYNTTHTSEVLPSLNYNEFEDIIKELKEIGLTDDEITQAVVEIMKAKYY